MRNASVYRADEGASAVRRSSLKPTRGELAEKVAVDAEGRTVDWAVKATGAANCELIRDVDLVAAKAGTDTTTNPAGADDGAGDRFSFNSGNRALKSSAVLTEAESVANARKTIMVANRIVANRIIDLAPNFLKIGRRTRTPSNDPIDGCRAGESADEIKRTVVRGWLPADHRWPRCVTVAGVFVVALSAAWWEPEIRPERRDMNLTSPLDRKRRTNSLTQRPWIPRNRCTVRASRPGLNC